MKSHCQASVVKIVWFWYTDSQASKQKDGLGRSVGDQCTPKGIPRPGQRLAPINGAGAAEWLTRRGSSLQLGGAAVHRTRAGGKLGSILHDASGEKRSHGRKPSSDKRAD